jgi:hypothetical protein
MEIYYSYTKLRKEFGRHCAFHDEAGEVRSRVVSHGVAHSGLGHSRSSAPRPARPAATPARGSPAGLTRPASCPQTLADIPPDEALQAQYVDRTPCTMAVQVGPEYSEHEARATQRAAAALGG